MKLGKLGWTAVVVGGATAAAVAVYYATGGAAKPQANVTTSNPGPATSSNPTGANPPDPNIME